MNKARRAEHGFDLRGIGNSPKNARAPWLGKILAQQQQKREIRIGLRPHSRQENVFEQEGPRCKTIRRIERGLSFGHVIVAGLKGIDVGRIGEPAQSDNLHPASQVTQSRAARATRAAALRIILSR